MMAWDLVLLLMLGSLCLLMGLGLPVAFAFFGVNIVGALLFLGGEPGLDQMARNAVHAAMAGKTGVMIGSEHDRSVNVPIPAVVGRTKAMDISGDLWRAVLQATGQPRW